MTDVHSKSVRSYNMSRILSKNTKPEMIVRKFLFSQGYRYRLHSKQLPGKPDIVLSKYRTVILVQGCFWHAHENCRYSSIPKSNVKYWTNKISRNISNDQVNIGKLKLLGWNVVLIWECELKKDLRTETLQFLKDTLNTFLKQA